jgi:hypothetical protein
LYNIVAVVKSIKWRAFVSMLDENISGHEQVGGGNVMASLCN